MARKEKVPAIGIDLGTTCSSVAVWENGRVCHVAKMPSYVAFTETRLLIGEAAAFQAESNPVNTIFDVKRLIGRRFTDTSVASDRGRWPFEVIAAGEKPMIGVTYKGEKKHLSAEEITAMILTKMKERAEAYLVKKVKEAVVSVPANFNDSQRQATKDAAQIAGLNVLRIINEPTAAALAYALQKNNSFGLDKKNVLIFDLGGGTFDVSILAEERGIFVVKATAGDTNLGGKDFDERMVDHFVKKFKEENDKLDISGDFTALTKLRTACEMAKRILSSNTVAKIEIDSLFQGIGLNTTISRAEFEELNDHLFNRCLELVNRCLKDVNMKKGGIDEVFLVGGSTRIPKIKQILEDNFNGKELFDSVNPCLSHAAVGAAVEAAMLQKVNQVPNVVTVDVTPLSIGIETAQGKKIDVVISRNEQIPISVDWMLTPESDKIYEGDSRRWSRYKNLLGKMELAGIPCKAAGDLGIDVSFEIDADGILTVKAKKKTIAIEKGRFSGKEIKELVKEAEKYKADDEEYKKKAKAKVAFQNDLYNMKKKIEEDGIARKISESNKEVMMDSIETVLEWLDTNETAEASEIEELDGLFNTIMIDKYNQGGEGSVGAEEEEGE